MITDDLYALCSSQYNVYFQQKHDSFTTLLLSSTSSLRSCQSAAVPAVEVHLHCAAYGLKGQCILQSPDPGTPRRQLQVRGPKSSRIKSSALPLFLCCVSTKPPGAMQASPHDAFNSIKAAKPEGARRSTKASTHCKEHLCFFLQTHLYVALCSYPWVQLAWQG